MRRPRRARPGPGPSRTAPEARTASGSARALRRGPGPPPRGARRSRGPAAGTLAAAPGGAARMAERVAAPSRPSSRSVTTSTPSSGARRSLGQRTAREADRHAVVADLHLLGRGVLDHAPLRGEEPHVGDPVGGQPARGDRERDALGGCRERGGPRARRGHGAPRLRDQRSAPRVGRRLGPPTTGKVSSTRASSGMQIFSHTSHDACALRIAREPGWSPLGAEIRVRRTTSPE